MNITPSASPQVGQQTQTNESEKSFKWLIIWLAVVAVCLLAMYFMNFNHGWGNQGDFGAFGDFLGGVLNPILGFATVGLLIWSLKMQMKELSLSNQQLALTRQELKETKEETALSRQAMEAQVAHLEKEAKLNEALRIIADLRTNISIVSNYRSVLSPGVIRVIIHALSTFSTTIDDISRLSATSINDLLYGDKKTFFENNENARTALREQYNLAIQYSEPSPLIELENLLLQFSTVAIYYHQESHSKKLTLVYLYEAERLLKPFQNAVTSELLQPSVEKLSSLIKLTVEND